MHNRPIISGLSADAESKPTTPTGQRTDEPPHLRRRSAIHGLFLGPGRRGSGSQILLLAKFTSEVLANLPARPALSGVPGRFDGWKKLPVRNPSYRISLEKFAHSFNSQTALISPVRAQRKFSHLQALVLLNTFLRRPSSRAKSANWFVLRLGVERY
ncbi:MAG: hypothetical protein WD151_05105, partial [Phycisphaeraceae bacterium]